MTETLSIEWSDFSKHVMSAFGSFRKDGDFADVTLACEDGNQMEAHKVILTASSPFFRNLLKRNTHNHPLIYMRGVKSEDLSALITFLYSGEAFVKQENVEAFLLFADELQVQGLAGLNYERNKDKVLKEELRNKGNERILEKRPPHRKGSFLLPKANTDIITDVINPKISEFTTNIQELDEKCNSLIDKFCPLDGKTYYICKVCGKKVGHKGNLKHHIEAKHIEGLAIACNFCEKSFGSRNSLAQHIHMVHKT